MRGIVDVIGNESADELRDNFWDMVDAGAGYDDIEDLLSSYGLEPDYIECLI